MTQPSPQWANLWRPRNDLFQWGAFLKRFFNVTYVRVDTGHDLHRAGRCLYLCNHRSWADFFIDAYLTEGRASMMSRWMVFFAFPVFMCSSVAVRAIVLFKRGAVGNKTRFNAWLDAKLAATPHSSLLLYPEAHRNLKPHSLPLKRGMLLYAHSRNLPVQIVMAAGKEAVMSERAGTVGFGAVLPVAYGAVLTPSAFDSFDAFWTEFQAEWNRVWAAVYAADVGKQLPGLKVNAAPLNYTLSMRLLQILTTFVGLVVAAGFLRAAHCAAVVACAEMAVPLVAFYLLALGVLFISLLVSRLPPVRSSSLRIKND